jgi:hypothetical protein
VTGALPTQVAATLMYRAGVDRLNALSRAIDIVRRGGTLLTDGGSGAQQPQQCTL